MQVQISCTDPQSGQTRQPKLKIPVAIGRTFELMPANHGGRPMSRIVLKNAQVSDYHVLLEEQNGQLIAVDQGSRQGISINGASVPRGPLRRGDRLQVGPYEIQIIDISAKSAPSSGSRNAAPPGSRNAAPAMGGGAAAGLGGGVAAGLGGGVAAGLGGAAAAGLGGAAAMAAGNAMMGGTGGMGGGQVCTRMVGFLFKRPCNRTNPIGCRYCNGGNLGDDDDPYFRERSFYSGYGSYRRGCWGNRYYSNRDRYYYDPDRRDVDFTEADTDTLTNEADTDYEQDMGAS